MTYKHPLEKYIADNGLTKVAFASSCGITRQTLHRLLNYKGEFSTALIKRVCKQTGGYLRPADFFRGACND